MPDFKPLNLLETRTYPGYQFIAEARYDAQPPRVTVNFIILMIMDWLRQKISNEELKQQLESPDIKEFTRVPDDAFRSVHFNAGFALDITYLPQKRIWAARVKEPDTERRDKKAVIGRFFVTEISVMQKEDCALLAVRIDVIDPLNPQLSPVAAYRPSFIKKLFRERRFKFRQVETLNFNRPHIVNNPMALKRLTGLITDRRSLMPIIVLTQAFERHNMLRLLERLDRELKLMGKPGSFSGALREIDLVPETLEFTENVLPYDADYMTEHTIGYARVYVIDDKMFDAFIEKTGCELKPGDSVWIEPIIFGGASRIIPYDPRAQLGRREYIRNSLIEEAHSYSRGKNFDFSAFVFEATARRMETEERVRSRIEELRKGDEVQKDAEIREYEELVTLYSEEKQVIEDENARLRAEIGELYARCAKLEAVSEKKPEPVNGIVIQVPELDEFYEDEMRDLVISVLKAAKSTYCAEDSRAMELLDAINSVNETTDNGRQLFERLKTVLSSMKSMSESEERLLRELGFEVSRFKNNHIKLVFMGNPRYIFTLPSTPGDHRSMKNCLSDITGKLSVYK